MQTEKKRVLITVKAYPNPSKKYKETVCCAGIDLSNGEWIRLYPIRFRYLQTHQQFNKYSIIEVSCSKSSNDIRPESYHVDEDSIQIVDYLDTANDRNWTRRKEIVMPTVSSSHCHIKAESELRDKSLGIFRPTNVAFTFDKTPISKVEDDEETLIQQSFFDEDKGTLEQIPFRFYYEFRCKGHDECKGHRLPIIDWELAQAFRKWRLKYKDTNVLMDKIKRKWLDTMCSENNDVLFIVGNQHRFRENFMVLGTFYPPLENQLSLSLSVV